MVVILAALGGFFFSFVMIRQLLGAVRRILATAEAGPGGFTMFTELSGPDELAQTVPRWMQCSAPERRDPSAPVRGGGHRQEGGISRGALEETVASMEEIRSSSIKMVRLTENSSAALEQTNAGVEEGRARPPPPPSRHGGRRGGGENRRASENSVAR